MKTLIKSLAALALVLFFNACKKSEVVAPLKTVLSKNINSILGTYTYTYNAEGRMATESYSGNALNAPRNTTFSGYDAQGKLIETTTRYPTAAYPDYKAVISYNSSGKVSSIYYYNVGSTAFTDYSTYDYTTGIVTWKVYNSTGTLTGRAEYSISLDGKNTTEYRAYNTAGAVVLTQAYSNYDTQINIDQLFPAGYSGKPENTNNWRTVISTNASGPVTTTFLYDYNADGYVTKRTASTGSTIEYEYIKQ